MKLLATLFIVGCLTPILVNANRRGGRRNRHEQELNATAADSSNRQGKLFSLFNVVTFKNGPCTSSETVFGSADRQRNGTCHTTTECQDKGGRAEGNCASGFGVCCIFIVDDDGGGDVNYNCSYIQNPTFSTATDAAGSFTYTINKCSEDVCAIRLDFETFTLAGPDVDEALGCNTDDLTITGDTGQIIPVICGENRGQHMYVDIASITTLTFTLGAAGALWDIKVSQIECNSKMLPPNGCLQYHVSCTGRIQTFNWDSGASATHLNDQDYSVCIRPEAGFCCIQYQVCPGQAQGFSLAVKDGGGNDLMAAVDEDCLTLDHIEIAESSSLCDQTSHLVVDSRYCGNALTNLPDSTVNTPICACNPPFSVGIYTNDVPDSGNDANINTATSRGLCLEYSQIPCAY